ncbi:MAG: hypothetical protein WCE68_11875 [Anaerolineales bacterium]
MINDNIGSNFNDFLEDEGVILKLIKMSRRMNTSRAALNRPLNPLILTGTPEHWKLFQNPGVLDNNFNVYFGVGA